MDCKKTSCCIKAILGPTNTGKTYFAIERMLGYSSGIIGFPLRLLARENYDRIVSLRGKKSVALITGEEKIIPPDPSWFVCTVESMPMDRLVDFLAIDEIQLCGDAERGHVFTERLLYARGRYETLFLGADTIGPLIKKLVPEAKIEGRSRFSSLRYTGVRKITRLPRRSAIVAFSVNEVYALAELVRRQRGGTAVVLGALSPRTRNAQVALYQEGEVDYMVATDAIGMGLNMHVDHIAFAGIRKFDGKRMRNLSSAEIGQVAGRAGRHMNDGTFGVTNDVKPFNDQIVNSVENHKFNALKKIYWRSGQLDYRSPSLLLRSLNIPPMRTELIPSRIAADQEALMQLSSDAEVEKIARNPAAVRQLWEVCQIPDFRKTLLDHHVRLLRETYLLLNRNTGRLPEDWVANQIGQLDSEIGGIDSLTARIAHIRTWTYITHRSQWLDNALYWQERTRNIEDRLSDKLHKKLAQRFIDRKAAMFHRKKNNGQLLSSINRSGKLLVEGEEVGRITGLKFIPSKDAAGDRAIMSAALRALRQGMKDHVAALVESVDEVFELSLSGEILWKKSPIAYIKKGTTALSPEIVLYQNENIDNRSRDQIERRLGEWLNFYLKYQFDPLMPCLAAECPATVRGICFHLVEGLGSTPRYNIKTLVKGIDAAGRDYLGAHRIKLGKSSIYIPELLNSGKIRLRSLLWSIAKGLSATSLMLIDGGVSYDASKAKKDFWLSTGYFTFGGRALRIDRVEKIASIMRRRSLQGPFVVTSDLFELADCNQPNFSALAGQLGFQASTDEMGLTLSLKAKPKRKPLNAVARQQKINPESPFAALKDFVTR